MECARWVDANLLAVESLERQRNGNVFEQRSTDEVVISVDELLQLTEHESMIIVREGSNSIGTKIEKLQEQFEGIPVFDSIVTVRTDATGRLTGDATGRIVQHIAEDLSDVKPRLTDDQTLETVIRAEGDENYIHLIGDIAFKEIIYIDDQSKAHLANFVVYLIDSVKRPNYIVDLKSGEILAHWNGLGTWSCGKRNYEAYGGNEKIGKIKYGDMPYCLNMTIDGDRCYMENQYVRVVDMGFSKNQTIVETASFICMNGTHDEVNGGYSPLVDAFFYGTVVGKMFEDSFDSQPLPNKAVLRVHYGEQNASAFWNGNNSTFGDGDDEMHPLTALDVVGHEIGHGVTELGSGLLYYDESGGVNEAFSDILGEAVGQYLAEADFMVGAEIMKYKPFLRDFAMPEKDNFSISKANDMISGMDPHDSSGVFRRAFYVTVVQNGLSVKDATKVYLHANIYYWHHGGTFFDCSGGILKAAIDLGISRTPFKSGFKDVGIEPCNVTNHIFGLSNNDMLHDVEVSSRVRPVYRFRPPPWAENVLIEAISSDNTSISISVQDWPWEEDGYGNGVSFVAEGVNFLKMMDINAENELFLQLSSPNDLISRVNVTVGYTCLSNYTDTSGKYEISYRYLCYGELWD